MKICRILFVTLSFLAVNIGLGSYVVAAATSELKETSQEISGTDSESGVTFHASRLENDRVVIDTYFGTKRFHADIDYTRNSLTIRSVSRAYGTPIALSVQDIVAFRMLLESLATKMNTNSRLGDALASLVNLMASASPGFTFDITGIPFTNQSFRSICPEIGRPGVATYTLGNKTFHKVVTVGPICYMDPAVGRCGVGGGPDPGIGFVQRFTQECLNHDACCGNESGICGSICLDEFRAAIPGFVGAPDCGTTAGNWTDNFGNTFVLTDDNGVGDFRRITGTANVATCGTWSVTGLRDGKKVAFDAANPTGVGKGCPAAYQFIGFYTDCNKADGSRISSSGGSVQWSWNRTNTVSPTVSLSRANAGPRPAEK